MAVAYRQLGNEEEDEGGGVEGGGDGGSGDDVAEQAVVVLGGEEGHLQRVGQVEEPVGYLHHGKQPQRDQIMEIKWRQSGGGGGGGGGLRRGRSPR